MKDPRTLHLVLKRKWWDMIESGEKNQARCLMAHEAAPRGPPDR